MKRLISSFLLLSTLLLLLIGFSQCSSDGVAEARQSPRKESSPPPPPMNADAISGNKVMSKSPKFMERKPQKPRTVLDPNHNTEDYSAIQENSFKEVSKAPLSTFSIDVDAASYSNLRRFIQNGRKPPKDAIRIEEMINYFDYDYPEPTGEHPVEIITEVAACT